MSEQVDSVRGFTFHDKDNNTIFVVRLENPAIAENLEVLFKNEAGTVALVNDVNKLEESIKNGNVSIGNASKLGGKEASQYALVDLSNVDASKLPQSIKDVLKGDRGLTGDTGDIGSVTFLGIGVPNNTYILNTYNRTPRNLIDKYINSSNGDYYEYSLGSWTKTSNIQGPAGQDGVKGDTGSSPEVRWSGTKLQVKDPAGNWGALVDLRGPAGQNGTNGTKGDTGSSPAHEFSGYSVRFQNPDGTWGNWVNLRGEAGSPGTKGDSGPTGLAPDHEWSGTSLRFRKPDGVWGLSVNLRGPAGQNGAPGRDGADGSAGAPGTNGVDGKDGKDGTDSRVPMLIDKLFTVGNGGDYPDLPDALEHITRNHAPVMMANGTSTKAIIQIIEGSVLTKQVILDGIDLSWINVSMVADAIGFIVDCSDHNVYNATDGKYHGDLLASEKLKGWIIARNGAKSPNFELKNFNLENAKDNYMVFNAKGAGTCININFGIKNRIGGVGGFGTNINSGELNKSVYGIAGAVDGAVIHASYINVLPGDISDRFSLLFYAAYNAKIIAHRVYVSSRITYPFIGFASSSGEISFSASTLLATNLNAGHAPIYADKNSKITVDKMSINILDGTSLGKAWRGGKVSVTESNLNASNVIMLSSRYGGELYSYGNTITSGKTGNRVMSGPNTTTDFSTATHYIDGLYVDVDTTPTPVTFDFYNTNLGTHTSTNNVHVLRINGVTKTVSTQ